MEAEAFAQHSIDDARNVGSPAPAAADVRLRRQRSSTAASEFIELWRSGATGETIAMHVEQLLQDCPLSGRMIHGYPDDPGFGRLLSTDEWKRLSWVFGPEALPSFLGKSAREICLQLGMGHKWLNAKVADGKRFKLAIFPAESADAQLATWDGVQTLLEKFYPEVWEKVAVHYPRIRSTPFAELEEIAGYSMLEVNQVGRNHATGESDDHRYISLQRLMVSRIPLCVSLWRF